MNVEEIWKSVKTHKKVFIIGILVLVLIIPCLIYLLLWMPIPTNNSDDNGWLSFWGSFLGGMFGGVGTLIAVYITVQQTRKIESENRNQIYISNINEEIKDYSTMLAAIKKNSTELQKYALEREDIVIVISKLMEFLELRDKFLLIAPMYLSKEIEIKAREIDTLYVDAVMRGYEVLNCAKNGKDHKKEMLVFYQKINDIITKFVELSLKLDEYIKVLYAKKYKKLHAEN